MSKNTAAEWFEASTGLIRQALASRLSRAADIDDLAQEVYLRLLRVPRPDLVRNPRAYLYRMAINVAEEWRQRAAQSLDHSSEALDGLKAPENLDRDAMRSSRERLVQSALGGLPLSVRSAVILRMRDGLTYEQTAHHMGVSRRAVKRYIAKGYAALRQDLAALAEPSKKAARG